MTHRIVVWRESLSDLGDFLHVAFQSTISEQHKFENGGYWESVFPWKEKKLQLVFELPLLFHNFLFSKQATNCRVTSCQTWDLAEINFIWILFIMCPPTARSMHCNNSICNGCDISRRPEKWNLMLQIGRNPAASCHPKAHVSRSGNNDFGLKLLWFLMILQLLLLPLVFVCSELST
jgi:hypothetical protein